MYEYEKLGVFYLGRRFDPDHNRLTDELILYDSRDLTTHAMCIGMTGSGKTGLCIDLLEEAAIDEIPAIVIDPKGDMANLALTFPDLQPESFAPWLNTREAEARGISLEAYAKEQADFWKRGLESWGQSGERIQRLREKAEVVVYTPGSTAGFPVSILKTVKAPPKEVAEDADLFHELVTTTVSSLLSLAGIEADPIQSREHILLSNVFQNVWGRGEDMDLSTIILSVQTPPFSRIGVIDMESFFPAKERFALAVKLNNLLASPSFQSWMQGEPLDLGNFLYTQAGKPRISVFYIAHLSDRERMFIVSLLLNQIIAWMRTQAGTTSLRVVIYFDEIFGYVPPVGNPPSKKPLLTLLKQARAFGVGVVLASQNPVDLDYKGLSNAGTWFIGRLQTERDLQRILDGLTGASGQQSFNRGEIARLISGLGKRMFLLHNVHESSPIIFQSRWALSYLAGPLTREQIRMLHPDGVQPVRTTKISIPGSKLGSVSSEKPMLRPGIPHYFISMRGGRPEGSQLVYQPFLYGSARVRYMDSQKGIDQEKTIRYITPITDGPVPVDWGRGLHVEIEESELLNEQEGELVFVPLPASANEAKNYTSWKTAFEDHVYRNEKLLLFRSPSLKESSVPGEDERDFRIRMALIARERRDEWAEKLRNKYATKIRTLENRLRSAEDRTKREEAQARQQKFEAALSIGSTVLGAFLGSKAISRTTVYRAGTAMRSAGRIGKEAGDVERARENLQIVKQQLEDMQAEFQRELDFTSDKFDALKEPLETVSIWPKKSAISVHLVSLVWVPVWRSSDGTEREAWR